MKSKKKNLKVHFSSASDNWGTPQWLFNMMEHHYGPFDLDVCASRENAKCHNFFDKDDDSLSMNWHNFADIMWMNPPYGRQIGKWVHKAFDTGEMQGKLVVCLLPARTDTKWWHDFVMNAGEIYFIKGRLKFGEATTAAPFPSAIVVFGNRPPMYGPKYKHLDIKRNKEKYK